MDRTWVGISNLSKSGQIIPLPCALDFSAVKKEVTISRHKDLGQRQLCTDETSINFLNGIIAIKGKGGIHVARFLAWGPHVSVVLEFGSRDFRSSLNITSTPPPRPHEHVEKVRHRGVESSSAVLSVCLCSCLIHGRLGSPRGMEKILVGPRTLRTSLWPRVNLLHSLGHRLVSWQMNTAKNVNFSQWFTLTQTLESS